MEEHDIKTDMYSSDHTQQTIDGCQSGEALTLSTYIISFKIILMENLQLNLPSLCL